MEIRILENCPSEWDLLIESCSWGSFYHTVNNLEILKTVTSAHTFFISCYLDGRLIGGLPYAVQRGPLGPVINCLSYFGSYSDAIVAPDAPSDAEKLIYDSLFAQCSMLNALCVTIITSPFSDEGHHENVEHIINPTFIEKRLSQIVHLPEPTSENRQDYANKVMSHMEGRARTAYRKVLKAKFELRCAQSESEVIEFSRIHRANIEAKSGIFKRDDFFLKTFEISRKEPAKAEVVIALDGEKLIAGVILFYFKDMVEYHTTCLLDEYRSIGPISRIIVERMIDAGMKGYRFWNFGGTWKTQESLYKFKKSFGAEDHHYFYYTYFFRDLQKVRRMTRQEILRSYPFSFVIPFSELDD